MNNPFIHNSPLAEELLIETAIRIELPPSQHKKAVERYEAISKYIEREDSPLKDQVRIFYPQGSMAIGATIKSRTRSDGYDIDIIAELILPSSTTPNEVLDLLFKAIKGEKGSRYYHMTERQTRCITVHYEDGMHLDVSPTILINEVDPRFSYLFHAKETEHESKHKSLHMNSHAFCEWFNEKTPIDLSFQKDYRYKSNKYYNGTIFAEAESKPVPAHSSELGGKSAFVVALQLLKRNRNLRYAGRKGLRMPPSVMMAKITADVAKTDVKLIEALFITANAILNVLKNAQNNGVLADVCNPRCAQEKYTDRFPESLSAQKIYIEDLELFISQLSDFIKPSALSNKQKLLITMFGEELARRVVEDYNAMMGSSVQDDKRKISSTGHLLFPSVSAPVILNQAAAYSKPPQHTFFGTKWRQK